MISAQQLHSALDWYVFGVNEDQHYEPGFTVADIGISGLDVHVIFLGLRKMTSVNMHYSRYGLRTIRYIIPGR